MPFSVGDLIDNHYRVEKRFAGGMGFVYVVMDEVVRKRFAIKQLSELHAEKPVLRERFRREAATWLQLDYHPHIVQARAYLPRTDAPMLILEYVDGPSLDVLLRSEKQLSPAQAIAYFRQVCAGMDHAHNCVIPERGVGVLHRDIKPGNILLTRANQVKITDFGLAKIQGDPNITSEGQFLGTIAYSSPEQLRGAGEVTRASDVYSFGAVMYQMLSGQQPFRANGPAELYRAIQETDSKPLIELRSDLQPGLATLIMQCLEKEPENRPADFQVLDAALAEFETAAAHARDRKCIGCGFLSRRPAASCPVCGTPSDGQRTKTPPRRTAPRKQGWKCLCGELVSDADRACPKCGRIRADGTPAGADPAAASWPVPADPEAPLPVPPASEPLPIASEPKSTWNLEQDKEYLVQLKADGALVSWELERLGYTIGRDPSMRIRLDDPGVARYQLFLVRLPGGWLAMNPQPGSRFEVNGSAVRQKLLRPADLVRIGNTWLAYSGPPLTIESQLLPGRWQEHIGAKPATVASGGSSPTTIGSGRATACTLELPGSERVTTHGDPIRIGTSPLCELRLEEPSVAHVQALVAWQADGPHLINVTSGFVRLVGGDNVIDRRLKNGDLLQIGSTPIRVRIEGDLPTQAATAVTTELPMMPRFAITVLTGEQKGYSAVLSTGQLVTIGRHPDCDVIISGDPFVSRRHLQLAATDSAVEIKDLAHRSGYFLNQTHYTDSVLAHLGDVLVVGKTSLLVHYELGDTI